MSRRPLGRTSRERRAQAVACVLWLLPASLFACGTPPNAFKDSDAGNTDLAAPSDFGDPLDDAAADDLAPPVDIADPDRNCVPDADPCAFPLPSGRGGTVCNDRDGGACQLLNAGIDWFCGPCACVGAKTGQPCKVAGLGCRFSFSAACGCVAPEMQWVCCSDVVRCPAIQPVQGGVCGCTVGLPCRYGCTTCVCEKDSHWNCFIADGGQNGDGGC